MHGLNGECWEDNVAKTENVLSNDMISKYFTFYKCHLTTSIMCIYDTSLPIWNDLSVNAMPGGPLRFCVLKAHVFEMMKFEMMKFAFWVVPTP